MQSNLIKTIKLLLILVSCVQVSAQSDLLEANFRTSDKMTEIPDSLLNEDAVIVLREVELAKFVFLDINSRSFAFGINSYRAVHKRIKILTQYGLGDYAQLLFRRYSNQELIKLSVRCIKPNRIIEIDSSDIFTEIHSHSEFMTYDNIKMAVPGVEIGDEIEFLVIFKSNRNVQWDEIYFHDKYPVMESNVKLLFPSKGRGDNYLVYNNDSTPSIGYNDTITIHTYKLTGLKGLKTQDFIIKQLELPYIYFPPTAYYRDYNDRKWRTEEENRLKKLRKMVLDSYSYEAKDGKVFSKKEIMGLDCVNDEMSKYEKLRELHDEINKNMSIENLSNTEEDQPVGYYFRVNRTDNINLNHIYVSLFNMLNIDFEFIMARSRYNGEVDMNILSYHQFDNIFFRFIDENGGQSYLFPKDSYSYYEINEIPPQYNGTYALIIPRGNKLDEKMIRIKYSESVSHFENRQVGIKINSAQNELLCDIDHSFGGSIYSIYKAPYLEAKEEFDEDTTSVSSGIGWLEFFDDASLKKISIDSISATYMKVKYLADVNAEIVQLEENIFSLPLKHFISHALLKTFDEERFLDYFPLTEFVQKINIFIQFDETVELLNGNDFDISYDCPICSYKIRTAQINDSTIYLNSEYDLKVDYVAVEDYNHLRELNVCASRASGLNLIYKTTKK